VWLFGNFTETWEFGKKKRESEKPGNTGTGGEKKQEKNAGLGPFSGNVQKPDGHLTLRKKKHKNKRWRKGEIVPRAGRQVG